MSLLFEVADRIAIITLNRPEVMNAMDEATYRELSEAWVTVRDDPDVWAAIITGAGDKAFTSGADLRDVPAQGQTPAWQFWQTQSGLLLNSGLEIWKPIIAAVNGYCLGGGMTLLLATDIRLAAESASFGLSEVQRGVLPANGGTQRMIRQLPYPVAMELLLTGDRIDAAEACRIGLVNRVVPRDELMPAAVAMAQRICRNGPLAVRAIKELAIRSQYLDINNGLRLEQSLARILMATQDAAEGPRAFLERREPRYKGE
jgi:E-phenylitaconyl-CoA hydratase